MDKPLGMKAWGEFLYNMDDFPAVCPPGRDEAEQANRLRTPLSQKQGTPYRIRLKKDGTSDQMEEATVTIRKGTNENSMTTFTLVRMETATTEGTKNDA